MAKKNEYRKLDKAALKVAVIKLVDLNLTLDQHICSGKLSRSVVQAINDRASDHLSNVVRLLDIEWTVGDV